VREIPITLHEKRPPSFHLLRRVPRVLKGLVQLGWTIRVRHRGGAPRQLATARPGRPASQPEK
jgi:hypothetical protein